MSDALALPASSTVAVSKGHGTRNDFVLLHDPEGKWAVSPELVGALCDRRSGIGGDGLIRAVRVGAGTADVPDIDTGDAQWFMDYRNHDGSVAQMCGNGVRVMCAYLAALGYVDVQDPVLARTGVPIATRAGVKVVYPVSAITEGGVLWRVDMGAWKTGETLHAWPEQVQVSPTGSQKQHPGVVVTTGNPHVVVELASHAELVELDLTSAPAVVPQVPEQPNVEFVVVSEGSLTMRVFERGSGETMSCGTGACAAALAVWQARGSNPSEASWRVHVPGGELVIDCEAERVWMTGPAVIVADVLVDLAALSIPEALSRHTGGVL